MRKNIDGRGLAGRSSLHGYITQKEGTTHEKGSRRASGRGETDGYCARQETRFVTGARAC
jgi:hypothetical protein